MRLLRLQDVEVGPSDRVYRHPRMRALVVWFAGFAATMVLLYKGYIDKWPPGYIFGSGLLLFVLLTIRFVTARFHPSNWLVRMNDAGLYVQYRSYLNYEMSGEDPSVVFLSFGEIASARLIKERVQSPDPSNQGATQTQYLRYVELDLSGETAPLVTALSNERGESPLQHKHWYGTSSTLYRDYPVTMDQPPCVRIRWNVVPRTAKFLQALRPYTVIAETISVHQDFTNLRSLTPEEQQAKLRNLAERGQLIDAAYLAQKLYGCSAGEARQMVDNLIAKTRAGTG